MGWLSNLINKAKKKTEETVQGAVQQGQQAAQNVTSGVQNAVQNVTSGYGDWINGVEQQVGQAVQQGQQAVQGAVEQGVQYAKDAAGNVINQVQPVVDNAAQQGQRVAQNAVGKAIDYGQQVAGQVAEQVQPIVNNAAQQGQQAIQGAVDQGKETAGQVAQSVQDTMQNVAQGVQNTVQNTAQGVTDKVNEINNQIQGNTSSATPSTPPSTAGEGVSNTPEQSDGSFDVDEPILTYEEFLAKEKEGLGYIKDETIKHIDNQTNETLGAIDEVLASGNKHAEEIKNTTDAALETQKQEVYKYAEETLKSSLGYNEQAYGSLVKAITEQMEAGKISAGEAKDLLMIMAEEAKNTTYGAAERQRQEAERQADINRQRAITDANSAYEQNKAEYGAKAEAMGRMGLNGGGYGDWLNASTYAQHRAETQAARAQSDAVKREAKYTEDMTKLEADAEYNNKKYQAESDYQNKLYDIDTSYRTNMLEAEQKKLAADKDAYNTERDTKMQADSDYNAGKLESDIKYAGQLYENESTAKEQTLAANQSTANAKLNAEISYVEGILGNSKALAEYKESLNAGTAEAEQKKLALYEQLLRGVTEGAYTADDAAALAEAFGFSQEWKNAIANSAGNRADEITGAENKANAEVTSQRYTSLLTGAANGTFNEATVKALAKEYGLSAEQTDELIKAAQAYATETGNAATLDKATQAGKTFVGLLDSIASGAFEGYSADQIAQIAGELGLTLTDGQKGLVDQAMKNYSGNVGEADTDYKNGVYMELLSGAKNGAYTEAEIADFVKRYGLDEGMASNLTTAVQDYNTNKTNNENEATAANKTNNFINMMSDVKNGKFTADEISAIASQMGFDANDPADKKLIDMLTAAAERYEAGVAEMDAATKTANFVDLLGMANSGQLTKDELMQVAKELGFDETADKTQLDLIGKAADRFATGTEEDKKAAKTSNFIALLDGANTGAYTSEQIAEIAAQMGFDANDPEDKKLIDMLSAAATAFANEESAAELKSDKNYMNGVYVELMTAAKNGDFDEAEIRDIASRFGFEGQDLDNLGQAAVKATDKAEETEKDDSVITAIDLKNNGYINSDTTDEEIDDYVEAGIIDQPTADKLKEDRNEMGVKEIDDMIKGGDYAGATKRAEELYADGTGTIDVDTYQNAYFEAQKNNCAQVKTTDDILGMEAELKNALSAGQISQADYDSLVSYMYQSLGGKLEKGSYSVGQVQERKWYGVKTYQGVTINGTSYEIKLDSDPNVETVNMLGKIVGGEPSANELVMFEGKLYWYTGQKWRCFKDKDGLYEAYNKQCGYQPKATAPKHTSDNTSSGGGGSGAAGGAALGAHFMNTAK